jgi:hypothetical protein
LELAAQHAEAAGPLTDAATAAKAAGKLIAAEPGASKQRAAAADTLRGVAEKLTGLVPKVPVPPESDPAAAAAAEAIGRAESAIRQALALLEANPDRATVEKVMRSAAEALTRAAAVRVEVKEQ